MNHIFDYDYTTLPINKAEELDGLERKITASYYALFDLINRLKQIRDKRLYLVTHSDFDLYLEERWGMCGQLFLVQCSIVSVVDDLLGAKFPIDLITSLPIILEYHNLDKKQRIELAQKVMDEAGDGKIDQAFTRSIKRSLFPYKCNDL